MTLLCSLCRASNYIIMLNSVRGRDVFVYSLMDNIDYVNYIILSMIRSSLPTERLGTRLTFHLNNATTITSV